GSPSKCAQAVERTGVKTQYPWQVATAPTVRARSSPLETSLRSFPDLALSANFPLNQVPPIAVLLAFDTLAARVPSCPRDNWSQETSVWGHSTYFAHRYARCLDFIQFGSEFYSGPGTCRLDPD